MTSSDFKEITKDALEKSLVVSLNRKAGCSNQGKITVRHRGDGSGRKYRIIDSKRDSKDDIPIAIIGIGYDPNRTADTALICYTDDEKAYILTPRGLTDGMEVMSGDTTETELGNYMPLHHISVGTQVHNIELCPGRSSQLIRSAGNSTQLMAKEGKYATLRLPPGEMKMVPTIYRATIGVVDSGKHSLINIDKTGRKHNMDIRPTVHGSVINPNDRPHGGGKGKCGTGRPGPCTPWGKPALDLKTRKKNKQSNKSIVRKRDGGTIR